jgi:23S rRNA-/tRNA-specific pseudouridylate synthase
MEDEGSMHEEGSKPAAKAQPAAVVVVPSSAVTTTAKDGAMADDDGDNSKTSVPRGDRNKRGRKPRSERNRKRPRSEVHPNDNEAHIQSKVIPLALDGERVLGGPPYLRVVLPYLYNFTSYAKARWVGRSVLDVYTSEFGGYPPSYYEMAISQGRILVSDKRVDPTYEIKATDVLIHCVHRHEPAVAVSFDAPPHITIASETPDIVAVDKPGTLPIHPCGGYHQNSLMKLMEKDKRYGKLYTIHRLDRLTGGLVILGKTSKVAQSWGKAIQKREHCEKLYLARVKGPFPRNCPSSVPSLADSTAKPLYGEFESDAAEEDTTAVSRARMRNAFGYWIEDSRGAMKPNQTLASFSTACLGIDECLSNLKNTSSPAAFSWLRFACPVRVAEPKRGVCVSQHFLACKLILGSASHPTSTSFYVCRKVALLMIWTMILTERLSKPRRVPLLSLATTNRQTRQWCFASPKL